MPYEPGLLGSPVERTRALIRLLDHRPPALDPELGLEYPELPTQDRMAVTPGALVGDVKLEPRPVEAARLADGSNVRRFEREEDA